MSYDGGMAVAPPSPSSTVVLLRPGTSAGPPECLLLQRNASASWLAGAWVFPGGRVDDGDREPAWEALALGAGRLAAHWPEADVAWLRDHAVAAVREVFEETGLLFADTVTPGRADQPPSHSPTGATHVERRSLLDGLASFASLCAHRRWKLRLDHVTPFSRWITPEQERRRFDTVFFMAAAPETDLRAHEHEMAGHAWLTAREALDRFGRQALVLAPPTLRTLEDLAPFGSLAEALHWARTVTRLVIAPKLLEDATGQWLLLPGDPQYPAVVTGAIAPPTRFAYRDGRWQSAPTPAE